MASLILYNTNLANNSVLSLVNENDDYIIITDQENIYEFINLCEISNVLVYFIPSLFRITQLREIYHTKKKIRNIFITHNIEEIYIFHQEFGGLYNWIIQYANSLSLKVWFVRVLRPLELKPLHSFKGFITKISEKLLYNTDVRVYKGNNAQVYTKFSSSFIRKNNIQEKIIPINRDNIRHIGEKVLMKIGIKSENKIVLFTGAMLSIGVVDKEDYQTCIGEFIEKIGAKNIICKRHPRFDDELNIERELNHIPSFIPSEIIYESFPCFVGVGSAALIGASEMKKTSVSLLLLFKGMNAEYKHKIIQYFKGTDIYMPDSYKELENLFNQIL